MMIDTGSVVEWSQVAVGAVVVVVSLVFLVVRGRRAGVRQRWLAVGGIVFGIGLFFVPPPDSTQITSATAHPVMAVQNSWARR